MSFSDGDYVEFDTGEYLGERGTIVNSDTQFVYVKMDGREETVKTLDWKLIPVSDEF